MLDRQAVGDALARTDGIKVALRLDAERSLAGHTFAGCIIVVVIVRAVVILGRIIVDRVVVDR